MSRSIDVVRLSGSEYDRLMDEKEIMRQECERAWKEVDAIALERDKHYGWRQDLADKLDEVERHRDALAVALNKHDGVLRALIAACNRLSCEAEEYQFDDGMGRGAMQDYWGRVRGCAGEGAGYDWRRGMSRTLDVVRLTGKEYDDLLDARDRLVDIVERRRKLLARVLQCGLCEEPHGVGLVQLKGFGGKAADARYTMQNLYAWEKHRTIECRLLPMFSDKTVALSAVRNLASIYDTYLSLHGFQSIHMESTVDLVGDMAIETYEVPMPPTTALHYEAEGTFPAVAAGPDIYYAINGLVDTRKDTKEIKP